jgi:hypothetical protein
MVMDQIFGGPLSLPSLDYLDNTKDLLPEMSMDLEDFQFDLDTIHDSLGSWIQPDLLHAEKDSTATACKSESVDFEELDITEAVRYDCMWSTSVPAKSSSAHNSSSCGSGGANRQNNSNLLAHPFCENALLDEFLRMLEPSCSVSSSPPSLDIKTEVAEVKEEEEEAELRSRAVMFTSLDHCYVSTTGPPPPGYVKHEDSSNFIDTPPESSDDDEEMSSVAASLPFHTLNRHHSSHSSNSSSRHLHHHHHRHISSSINNNVNTASLLKMPSQSSGSSIAKFSFRVKLKADSSRSVLKRHLRGVRSEQLKVVRTSAGGSASNSSLMQAGVRRRKEASLKLKHDEAREVHNQMERQRRNELKLAFDELKASITDIADSDKVSKQMILDKAVESCRGLRSREAALRLRRERLKRNNALLKERLQLLRQQHRLASHPASC